MATEFIYVKAANVPLLRAEIDADVTIVTAVSFIYVDGTDLHIHFVSNLSGSEVTALNAVVAAHTGTPSVEPGADESLPAGGNSADPDALTVLHDRQHVSATSTVTTTSTSYTDLDSMTLTTRSLEFPGNYLIHCSAHVSANSSSTEISIRLLVDGTQVAEVVALGTGATDDENMILLAHMTNNLASGKIIKVQWKTDDSGHTITAKRRSLTIDGITQARVLTS